MNQRGQDHQIEKKTYEFEWDMNQSYPDHQYATKPGVSTNYDLEVLRQPNWRKKPKVF